MVTMGDLSGVINDKKVPVKLKNKLYKKWSDLRWCWALRKQEKQRLYITEMKMLIKERTGKTELK